MYVFLKYIQWGMWQFVADWIYFEVKLISVNKLVALLSIFTTENDIYDASGYQLFHFSCRFNYFDDWQVTEINKNKKFFNISKYFIIKYIWEVVVREPLA